jgi:hypothetical protein
VQDRASDVVEVLQKVSPKVRAFESRDLVSASSPDLPPASGACLPSMPGLSLRKIFRNSPVRRYATGPQARS